MNMQQHECMHTILSKHQVRTMVEPLVYCLTTSKAWEDIVNPKMVSPGPMPSVQGAMSALATPLPPMLPEPPQNALKSAFRKDWAVEEGVGEGRYREGS